MTECSSAMVARVIGDKMLIGDRWFFGLLASGDDEDGVGVLFGV